MRYFRFTWGPPNLARAVQAMDPRHITRAPRRACQGPKSPVWPSFLSDALAVPGAELLVLRRYNPSKTTYDSWYLLPEPVAATVAVGRANDPHVFLRYDPQGPRQCARFCIKAEHVPEDDRATRYVKVVETLPKDAKEFTTISITATPEVAYEQMQRGEELPGNVMAQLNRLAALKGPRSKECKALWAALRGEAPVLIEIT